MKIVITGKNGLLSTEIQKINKYIIPLSSKDFDITVPSIIEKLEIINPDIIIHSAAITDSNKILSDPILSIKTNIIGTSYISEYCIKNNKRLIYISTDYIYPGDKGNYKESDDILPYNEYAWTKLGGECSVRQVNNHLIIRTSFGNSKFPYKYAFSNQIVSKDYVDIIAPKILKVSLSNTNGIINIGTEPKTVYEYASKRNKVEFKKLKSEKNFSLNLDRYNNESL